MLLSIYSLHKPHSIIVIKNIEIIQLLEVFNILSFDFLRTHVAYDCDWTQPFSTAKSYFMSNRKTLAVIILDTHFDCF